MPGRWKNLSDFLLNYMTSYQDLTFSIRIQDGVPRGNQRGKKENAWQVEKPQRLFIGLYEVVSGLHFFYQDPGWDPKRQPKGQKGKRLAGVKTLAIFFGFYEVASGPHFSHQDPGWDPKGQPKGQKGKCLAGGKTLATFYWIL